MTWNDGYICDVGYPAFFYKEMQPLWLSTVAGLRGFAVTDADGPIALCELGCGVGVNLLVAAACHPDGHFTGVDFNEEHLRLARDAARECGIGNVEFIHADFATFSRQNDRQFDYVTCHGAWSWIAPQHRAALLDCAARGLKPQGLFYLHYMCHPGSTEMLQFQHLLNLCAHHLPGPSPRRAQTGMALLKQVAEAGLFAQRPAMLQHLANMARRDPADIAHEFLTDHWHPQHSVDVHRTAGEAGLALLGSADVFANLDVSLSVPGRMQQLVRRTAAPALAETLKDMARNAHQRMDLFQKQAAPSSRETVMAHLRTLRMKALPGAPRHGPVTFETPIGPITGPEAVFTPLLERLAQGPATGTDLLALPVFAGDADALLQALQLLMMQQIAHPALQQPRMASDQVERLSRWLARNGLALSILADCATAAPG